MEPGEYCRQLEAYLCRKNDGHLIRIVGPAFEKVSGWAAQGIPFNVACRGIDRSFERYYAKGPRRRPLRIEFCEADVLDAFDQWRRSIGVGFAEGRAVATAPSRESLPTHLDRVIARLTAARAGGVAPGLDAALGATVRELEALRAAARGLRGDARSRVLARLDTLERDLSVAVREAAAPEVLAEIEPEARQELAPFAPRMAPEEHARALRVCEDRLLRERAGLPRIRLE